MLPTSPTLTQLDLLQQSNNDLMSNSIHDLTSQQQQQQATLTEVTSSGSSAEDDTVSSIACNSMLQERKDDLAAGEVTDDGYSSRSPILVNAEKLDKLSSLQNNQHDWVSVFL